MYLKAVIDIKLNIFFYSRIDRVNFLKESLGIKNINKDTVQVLTPTMVGLDGFRFRNSFRKNPGYWLELVFSEDQKGRNLYEQFAQKVAHNKKDSFVFYPTIDLPAKQLQAGWTDKYNFCIKDQHGDKWKLFFRELKEHVKCERMDNAYVGLNLLLRYNPFFLKKYKRYYMFERLAYYYEQQGNIAKAIRCLRLQSVLSPESVEPHLNISSFYIINNMEEDAIRACKIGLQKNPKDQYLMSNLVIALSNIGDHDSALAFLKQTLKDDSKDILLWKLMGDLYYEMDNNKEAIKCYKTVLGIKNENIKNMPNFYGEIYNSIGACYFEEEKYSKAAKYYKKVLMYNPNDNYTLLSLSQIYFYYLGDVDTALNYTKLLVDQVPDSGFGQYQLGLIYMEYGCIEKSRWHLYKARRLMPDYAPVHDAIEMIRDTH
ncbi:MAG: tetratricopeptide repeat protein [Natronincolaceae bacterium]|nr:tetratricopeptide repeat protein [Bacillota bacterium]NLK90186.1 tetratricopeptide repeat protein [Clostridiales bacterium]